MTKGEFRKAWREARRMPTGVDVTISCTDPEMLRWSRLYLVTSRLSAHNKIPRKRKGDYVGLLEAAAYRGWLISMERQRRRLTPVEEWRLRRNNLLRHPAPLP